MDQTSSLKVGGGKKYFYFITLLRAFAAIIITNAHYTGIYPSDIIANGGLLGDVIFFSVSGFCLANPHMPFKRWYPKRLWRIYAVVWIATLFYVIIGSWQVNNFVDFVKWFIHPTKYHFIASISLLYIPLYYVAKHVTLDKRMWALLSAGLLAVQSVLYFCVYDISYYHIDNVRQPMIEFLFFQSMLMGLFFREELSRGTLAVKKSRWLWIALGALLIIYFGSKMLFVKLACLSEFQLLNQVILLLLLFVLFICANTLEDRLHKIANTKFWKGVVFLSDRTLEIYCVQYVIIDAVRGWGLAFPLNWVVLTSLILIAATALHWMSQKIISFVKI